MATAGDKICIFYNTPRGCRNGEVCQYLHCPKEKMPVCTFYGALFGCRYGESCGFRHEEPKKISKKNDNGPPKKTDDHPTLAQAYVDKFIKECSEWDEVEENAFELQTGEKVESKFYTKYLTNKTSHYIMWRKWFVNGEMVYENSLLKDGFYEREGSETKLDDATTKLLDTIDEFLDAKRRVDKALPALKKLWADDFDIFSVNSATEFVLKVQDQVAFGDVQDVTEFAVNSQNVAEDKKPIVRTFYPGKYIFSYIKPVEDTIPVAIFHLLDVDPEKIVKQLINMPDANLEHKDVKNALDHHDWCKWAQRSLATDSDEWRGCENYSDKTDDWDPKKDDLQLHFDDKDLTINSDLDLSFREHKDNRIDQENENTIYFTNNNDAGKIKKSIRHGRVDKSEHLSELFQIKGRRGRVLALSADYGEWYCGDGAHGKLFEDKTTGRCFALVVHSPISMTEVEKIPEKKLKELFPDHSFSTVKETQLVFDIKDYLHDGADLDEICDDIDIDVFDNEKESVPDKSREGRESQAAGGKAKRKPSKKKYLGYKFAKKELKCGFCRLVMKATEDGRSPEENLVIHYKEMLSKVDSKHMAFFRKNKLYMDEFYCYGCNKCYEKPTSLMKHISLRMRQKKRLECAKKHRAVFTQAAQAFADYDLGKIDEILCYKKLVYLLSPDHGSCIENMMDPMMSDSSGGLGFCMDSDDEFELMCQGIKPWDSCAMDALAILNGLGDF